MPWAQASVATAAMGGKLTKYLEQLPLPGKGLVVATPTGPNRYSFTQTQISRRLHSQLPPTPLWAYDDGSGLGGQAGSFGLVLVAKTGTPVRASFTHAIPDVYPAWIPVDTRLTPLGDKVRLMTHLHGGFVAAESDGNPAITPNGFGPGETQTVFYTRPAATDRRFVAVVPRPRARHHRLNVFADWLPPIWSATSTTPAPSPTPSASPAGLRDPAGRPGPPVQPRRDVALPGQPDPRVGVDTAGWVLTLNGLGFMEPATETPVVDSVEDRVYVNLTGDTHPMHTHLFTHQVVRDRTDASARS